MLLCATVVDGKTGRQAVHAKLIKDRQLTSDLGVGQWLPHFLRDDPLGDAAIPLGQFEASCLLAADGFKGDVADDDGVAPVGLSVQRRLQDGGVARTTGSVHATLPCTDGLGVGSPTHALELQQHLAKTGDIGDDPIEVTRGGDDLALALKRGLGVAAQDGILNPLMDHGAKLRDQRGGTVKRLTLQAKERVRHLTLALASVGVAERGVERLSLLPLLGVRLHHVLKEQMGEHGLSWLHPVRH